MPIERKIREDRKKIQDYFNTDLIKELFNSLDVGVHIIDSEGITVLYNKTCEKIEGINSKWIIGTDMSDLVKRGIYSESIGLEVIETKKKVAKTQRVNKKYIFSTGIPIFSNGELINVVISVVDMTSMEVLKKKLDELQDINSKIQRELDILKTLETSDTSLISQSKKMERIKLLALRISNVDANVLIEGESGVGKGVLSKFIHRNSSRSKGPFIKIDCGSLAPSLIESELFGYEKGAFTGAKKEGKPGLIELGNNGTLFLDEIGELPLNLQVKLLNVIQDKTLQRVGGTESISIDTRIIAATNRDLYSMVQEGNFRMDLYYRLKVVHIVIPPLRERKEDLVPLINLFLEKLNKKYNYKKIISSKAMKLLLDYDWPGNVRELENEIKRLVVISQNDLIDVENILDGPIGDIYKYGIDEEKKFKENVYSYERILLREYL